MCVFDSEWIVTKRKVDHCKRTLAILAFEVEFRR
jgi:hypothetical protein